MRTRQSFLLSEKIPYTKLVQKKALLRGLLNFRSKGYFKRIV